VLQHFVAVDSEIDFSRRGILSQGSKAVMKSDRLKRLARMVIGALMLLFIQGFLAPHVACAGCNHLVISRLNASLDFNGIDELVMAGSMSVSADPMVRYPLAPGLPERPTPCAGMSCSSRVPLPTQTVAREPRNIDQFADLGTQLVLEPTPALTRSIERPASNRSGYKPSIFHPPPG